MRKMLVRASAVIGASVLLAALVGLPGATAKGGAKCFGKPATIVSNRAHINGTSHADVIVGGAKANTINGKGGADLICAGGGADTVNAGGGNDKVKGGPGSDGSMFCATSLGLYGGGGNDTVLGGGGDNCIWGGAGNDKLLGGGGNDTIYPGTGSDSVDGGSNGNPLTGGGLGDTAAFIHLPAGVNASLTTGKATSGGDTDTLKNIENLGGSRFDDTLVGNANGGTTPNGLEGGPGNDTLDGGGGFIEIAAFLVSQGAETVTLGNGSSAGTATGGEGNDTLTNITAVVGSSFNDTITRNNRGTLGPFFV